MLVTQGAYEIDFDIENDEVYYLESDENVYITGINNKVGTWKTIESKNECKLEQKDGC